MDWIKWYQEIGVRQQENDLRAVALQNQKAELNFNMERLRQQGVAQEQANQPLYTMPGEVETNRVPNEPSDAPYPSAERFETKVGPETPGPTPNQVEAVQKVGQYMTPEGLKKMGMAPRANADKLRNVSPGDRVINEAGVEVYKAPAAPQKQAIDWKQDAASGEWVGLPATVDLPSLMTSGEIPPNAVVTDAGNGQVEVRVSAAQQNQQVKEANVSPVPMQGRGQVSQAPQPPKPAQQPVKKPQQGVTPIHSGVIGKTTPTSPHNDLESYTGTLYPGKTWTDLTPKEQDKVYAVMAKEASAKRGPAEGNAQREHIGNAYKSAYYLEMNKLMAIYKLIPPAGLDVSQPGVIAQMIAEGKDKGKISKERWPEFAKAANEIYSRNMVPWYKLYNLKAPEMEFPTNEEGVSSKGADTTSDYIRDANGKLIPNPNKKKGK
jgi:hypothetical protein